MPPQIAVVLSGCGVFDGTEVHEAAAALGKNQAIMKPTLNMTHQHYQFLFLAALSRAGAEVKMFAPNINQDHVVDHSKGAPADQSRK